MVIGDPFTPLAWVESVVVIEPQRCIVVPGPICVLEDPQLLELLKNEAASAVAQELPFALPTVFCAMYKFGAEANALDASTKHHTANSAPSRATELPAAR